MTISELRYLVRAHFGRAAVRCHVSQPTLSKKIRKLDAHVTNLILEREQWRLAFVLFGDHSDIDIHGIKRPRSLSLYFRRAKVEDLDDHGRRSYCGIL
jgi:hypothetical protein